MESNEQIEERAAAWLVKRDSGEWTDQDAAALTEWLDADTAHCVTFIRLEAAWEHAKRLKALGSGVSRGVVPPPGRWRLSPLFGRGPALSESRETRRAPPGRGVLAALAASVVLALCIGTYLLITPSGERYTTPLGVVATVPMADGSRITLNTASEIRVAVTPELRRVELKVGEAFFEVAKDPGRPFVVSAGDKRVIAVGTRFSVRREPGDVRVVVTEGRVRIEGPDSGGGTIQSAPEPLGAGTVARASAAGLRIERKPLPEIEEQLSWRSGYLVFHEITLAEAAAEFNRYNSTKIVIEDPSIAEIRMSGKFRATNFDAFVRILANGFAIRQREEGDRILLSARE